MNWTRTLRVIAVAVLGATMVPLGVNDAAVAQQPPTQPPTKPPTTTVVEPIKKPAQPPTQPTGRPSGAGAQPPGKTPADSGVRKEVKLDFAWEPADSAMRELLDRQGYRRVQYQGDRVVFDAKTKELIIRGKPSAVKRDETMMVGDSIAYNDSTKKVVATGDTVWLRDPSRAEADDFVARGRIDYDLESRSGITGAFETSVESGQRLYLTAQQGSIFTDTLVTGRHIVFAKNGSFTYCDHAEPHFHFTTRDMKFVSENVMVARPGVLYIGEVPVFWIPFFFQDVRTGRRSGLTTPTIGVAELLRNSPSYRRSVNNIGYFFAINDYSNAQATFDWRSGANGTASDPGFLRGNVEYNYRWLNRFITGQTAVSYLAQNDGTTNMSYTWNHNQDFSKQTRLTARINFVQNTLIQRNSTIDPVAANATIRSDLSYQTKMGPAQINLGGNRTQYPGRPQVDMNFPALSISTGTLGQGFVSFTPAMRLNVSSSKNIDQGLQFPYVYNTSPDGSVDSSRFRADRRNMQFAADLPIKLGEFRWQNAFSVNETFRDYPEQREVIDVRDTSKRVIRVFAQTFESNADWTTSFSLPSFLRGTWNVSPSVNVSNIDPASGMWVRTERSGGKWVSQNKRLSYAVSTTPTFYGFLPGFGVVSRIRNTLSPSLQYSFSPTASVSDEYLQALGRTRVGYLGALKQNRVSLGFSTVFEAKLRAPVDSNPDSGKKIKLLSMQFSPLTYDFVRKDSTGKGFTDRTFTIAGRTDLLPGLDFRTSYELFQGDPMSDTAVFLPYRTDIGVSFGIDGKSALVGLLGRLLLGKRSDGDFETEPMRMREGAEDTGPQGVQRQQNAAGSTNRVPLALPSGQGWRLSIQYNAARQRPPVGGDTISNDPTKQCEGQKAFGTAAYDRCILQAQSAPPTGLTSGQSAIGAPFFITPPTQNISGSLSFNITPKWAAQWSSQYDITRSRFAAQQIGLQRELHDWNAVFSFTQAPNGNFAFTFNIALKAQPDLKFNYDRQTYRSTTY